jgi:alpha-L-fucosidase 2
MRILVATLAIAACAVTSVADDTLRLRYESPAAEWNEALPLGNGRIGAMVFGGTEEERVQINEATLWGGVPHDYARPGAAKHLPEIRRLIFAGRVAEAEALSAEVMGAPKLLMPYQPFCDLRLHFPGHAEARGYHRGLRLDDAIAETSYTIGDTRFEREVFVSHPDQVLVVRLVASRPGQLTFSASLGSPQAGAQVKGVGDDSLELNGRIQPRENPAQAWTGSWDEPGLTLAARVRVLPEGGSVRSEGARLEISGADAATLLLSAATSFVSYRDVSGDPSALSREHVNQAAGRSYGELRGAHVDDFAGLFSRVELHLGELRSDAPTNERIARFAEEEDPGMLALYYAFGRYLLISSSRPGGQPANLQGIWNQELLPAWSSKWTTNINLEMNYWLADSGNLWETLEPLWGLIRDLRMTGADTARAHYASRGWVLHHNTDLWRATTPVDGPWGVWPMGAVWLANQMWDHYEFSEDPDFLAHDAYPAMKEAAQFVLDLFVEAPEGSPVAGKLVTNPSTSPENRYVLGEGGFHLTYAATMDIQLIRELFASCVRAAGILGQDAELATELGAAAERLPSLRIGARGQLQEWIEDYAEVEPEHRHVSHLYALYPGNDIDVGRTTELAAAARRTLELRGDGGTGWAAAWKAALWARLGDGERAYANVRLLLTKHTLPNMFDLHPPFQIDGNLGGSAAITEMLVQSTGEQIRLLPALPEAWPNGSLSGVRVRGGARVDVTWSDGRLSAVRLLATHARSYRLRYGDRVKDVSVSPGTLVELDGELMVPSVSSAQTLDAAASRYPWRGMQDRRFP